MAEVGVEGLDRLYASFDTCIEEINKAAKKGLQNAGMTIIADAQRNIRTAGHNGGTLSNTGQLSQSGKVQEGKDDEVDVGFFSKDGSRGYAAAVEYGTKAHWVPVAMLEAWVRKKLRVPYKDLKTATFLVNRKIARKGTPPHPFFAPAVSKNTKAISKAITDAINKVTNRQ